MSSISYGGGREIFTFTADLALIRKELEMHVAALQRQEEWKSNPCSGGIG
jgi:hypothetical protein